MALRIDLQATTTTSPKPDLAGFAARDARLQKQQEVSEGVDTVAEAIQNRAPSMQRLVNLAIGQSRVLELIAGGAALPELLAELLLFVEREVPELLCSILLLDADGAHLRHGAAPSLPEAYVRAIDGSAIGPCSGSCGTAAYLAQQVVVEDIETDPLWAAYGELARPHGFRACWSTPIFSSVGDVLGTFAMYFREPRRPEEIHKQLIEIATRVASIAIEKEFRDRSIQESEERYRLLNLATNDAVWDWDVARGTLWWNESVQHLFGYAATEVANELSWWSNRVHPDDRQRVHDSLQHAADTGGIGWREDYRFQRRDGTYADIQDRGYVMRDASGKTVRMIGAMQDVSESKRAEAERRRLQQEVLDERGRIFRATMITVQDITNNLLNNLQWIRIEGEGRLSEETLALFDTMIAEGAEKLNRLANIQTINERAMAVGIGIAYPDLNRRQH
jgi:PAS domain S-box-containing protein